MQNCYEPSFHSISVSFLLFQFLKSHVTVLVVEKLGLLSLKLPALMNTRRFTNAAVDAEMGVDFA